MDQFLKSFENFTENRGGLIIIVVLFLLAFAIKTMAYFSYEAIKDKIEHYQFRKNEKILQIIETYENNKKIGKDFGNTMAFVEREMHSWRIKGIHIEKMSNIGDFFDKLSLITGISLSFFLIGRKSDSFVWGSGVMKCICLYIGSSLVLCIFLKAWDNIISVEYKRKIIRDEIINYLDNHPSTIHKDKPIVNVDLSVNQTQGYNEEINPLLFEKHSIQEKKNRLKKKLQLEENKCDNQHVSKINKKEGYNEINQEDNSIQMDESNRKLTQNKDRKNNDKSKEIIIAEILDEFLS